MRPSAGLAFLGLTLMASSAWADCPLDLGHGTGWVLFSQHYMIAFRPDPPHFEAGAPLTLILNVCTKGGDAAELVGIEVHPIAATPPANQRDPPSADSLQLVIVPGGDGRYRAEGLLLAKPGRWEVNFDVRSKGDTERLTHEIEAN